MEFGFPLPQTGAAASPEALVRTARRAEELGYRTLWVLERLLRPLHPRAANGGPGRSMPDSYAFAYDPIDTLAYVAAHTSRIKLGTSILLAPFHAPVILAKRLATLDHFSGGRVIAGLGQGWSVEEFRTANIPLKRRGQGFQECIAAMRAAWGPDPVSFSGRFYQIPESQIGPKPLQPGGPPILIAAQDPVAVERAARIGDGLNPIPTAWDTFEATLRRFRSAAREAHRDPDALPIVVRTNTAVSPTPVPDPRPPLVGSHEQVVEDLRRLRALGVAETFFDMTRLGVPVDEQFRLVERLRAAVA